jgi:hypothetical protein
LPIAKSSHDQFGNGFVQYYGQVWNMLPMPMGGRALAVHVPMVGK